MEAAKVIGALLAAAGIISGLKPLCGLLAKLFNLIFRGRDWVKKQDEQTDDIEKIRQDTNKKLQELDEHYKKEISEIKEEQSILVYGSLACLKGLEEQGCDGPVHDGIRMIEDYLNRKAHEQE